MKRWKLFWLVARALWELLRYDGMNVLLGFQRIHRRVERMHASSRSSASSALVVDAVAWAACFYWKPALCLQRSVVTTVLLRKYGIPARLVIGYRPAPFFSHAWVEVDGRTVNDSPFYRERLQILCTV